ncbi:hypothetical protein [Paraflavitalea speifideaquila]|uniref:hypothetical protein n=1 Tax=Paraflavitalea speifideaquila TaxID=3076558 RepID=UPI0028E87DCD|nr:hypothetical protein [Paraflavitalea speifideiaquila]
MMQPTINPLFQTRPFQDSLLKWAGNATAAYDVFFKNYWTNRLGSHELYTKALQDGVIEGAGTAAAPVFTGSAVAQAISTASALKNQALLNW